MRLKVFLMIFLAGYVICASASEVETVPFGPPPLLNGIEGDGEWQSPAVMELELESVMIRFKQDSQFIYIGVSDKDTLHSGIDLYLDNLAGDIRMFHISSAHGERQMNDSGWGESDYGAPEFWTSNILENVFVEGKMKFLAPEIFEFQIDKILLPSLKFKMMIHLKRPEMWIPTVTDINSSDSWIEVMLR